MKNKIQNCIWALRIARKNSLFPLLLYFFVRILGETLVVLLAAFLSGLLETITRNLAGGGSVFDYLGIVSVWIACLLLSYLVMMLKWRISERVIPLYSDLKYNTIIFRMYQNVPYKLLSQNEFLRDFKAGTDGIGNINQYIISIIQTFALIYNFVLTNIILFHIHWIFCVITIAAFIAAMLIEASTEKINFALYQKADDSQRIAGYYEKVLMSRDTAKEIRLFNLGGFFLDKWQNQYDTTVQTKIEAARKIDWKFSAYEFLCDITALLSLALGFVMASKGLVTVGAIIIIWNTVNNTLTNIQGLQRSVHSIDSINAKLTYARDFYTRYYKNPEESGKREGREDALPVSLRDVSFSYRDGHTILHNINLDIHKGEIVALCGDNGSGKSTLVKVILGLMKPDSGDVSIWGNHDVEGRSFEENNIAAIFQDFVKYPMLLRENIGFGKISEMTSDDALAEALLKADGAGILEKVGSLDTILGREIDDHGKELSGGEWQRIALARIFMGNQDIMIFDEPAASLDPISEKNQFDRIREELQGKTGILISHRIGFASMADRIVVLEHGEIIEDGSHAELMAQHGKYYSMYTSQASWYLS